jgi:hypothetical protein
LTAQKRARLIISIGLNSSGLTNIHEKRSTPELKRLRAKKLGKVDSKVLPRLIAFVEKTPALSQEDKDAIVDGLADWA